MPRDNLIEERDVRAMVRLLGEVAANAGDHAAKRRQLMAGACALVGADAWIWGVSPSMEPGKQPVYLFSLYAGFAEEQFGRWMAAMSHPSMVALHGPLAAALARKRGQVTRLAQELDPEFANRERREWVGLMHDAGFGCFIVSARWLDGALLSGVGLYRRLGHPPFGRRECRIAHILMDEMSWLHELGTPADRAATVPQLPNRARSVLNLLVQGFTRKQIASAMKLSGHTANDYVKAVYRHFGVNSQVHLVNRFLRGDGGDQP